MVVSSAISMATMTQAEIDSTVSERMRNGQSLYQVDEKLLQELAPDLILTQDLCQVCAPSGNEVTQALAALPSKPEILWLTPKSLAQIEENLREIGAATGSLEKAEALIASRPRHPRPHRGTRRQLRRGLASSAWSGLTRSTAAVIGFPRW